MATNKTTTIDSRNGSRLGPEQEGLNWAYLGLYIIPVLTVWGNVLVCISVFVEARLKSRFNSFLVSLSISDLLCAVLVMPVSAFKMISGGNIATIPRSVCLVWYSLDVFFTASTIIHLCTISIDRYFALNNPLKYHRQKRKSALVVKIVCTWLIPFSIAGPLFAFALWLDTADEDSFKGCGPHNAYFIITATVVTFFLPLLIMTVTYVLTVSTIVRQTKNARDLNASLLPLVLRPSAQAFGLKRGGARSASGRKSGASLLNSPFFSRQSSGFGNFLRPNQQHGSLSAPSPTSPRALKAATSSTDGASAPAVSPSRQRLLPPASPVAMATARHRQSHSPSMLLEPPPDASPCRSTLRQQSAPVENGDSGCGGSGGMVRLLRVPSRVSVSSVYSDDGMLLPSSSTGRRRTDSISSGGGGDREGDLGDGDNCTDGASGSLAGKKLSFTLVTQNAKRTFKPTASSEQKKRMDYIHRGSKAVQVLGILFGLFVACYLPFFIAYLIDYFCLACRFVTSNMVPILEWVAYSASMLNPIVYHFFNPTFRKTFHRLMRCQCQRYGSGKRPNYVFTYKIGRPAT